MGGATVHICEVSYQGVSCILVAATTQEVDVVCHNDTNGRNAFCIVVAASMQDSSDKCATL